MSGRHLRHRFDWIISRHLRAVAAALALVLTSEAAAQQDSTTVTAGPQYEAGAMHRLLLGEQYRDLWTANVRVPVLDLDSFARGLIPVRRGGGRQTRSLRFQGADLREYNFSSVDKEITKGLPPWLKETLVGWVLQDQTSSLHPAR